MSYEQAAVIMAVSNWVMVVILWVTVRRSRARRADLEEQLRTERATNITLHRLLLDDLDDERKKHLDTHATGV